jgi:UDP-glucose 4-epimerase
VPVFNVRRSKYESHIYTKMRILVTGGCGYIGSHTIVELLNNGHTVVCVDSCVRSSPAVLEKIKALTGKDVQFYKVDMTVLTDLEWVFLRHGAFDGVIHFAAFKSVGESVANPLMYYENNLCSLLNLLHCCTSYNVKNVVFSSSCTVYGEPDSMPVTEITPLKPAMSPYGATKQICERILTDFVGRAGGNSCVCLLRYFNPAGAHPSLLLGEMPQDAPLNLVPVLVDVAAGRRPVLTIFGGDYPTRDGTCVRDYIHVCDIARAHMLALEYMIRTEKPLSVFNLGAGNGSTVLEAIQAFIKANNMPVPHLIADRRPGDVSSIYADNTLASTELGWHIQHTLEDIMKTAWGFYTKSL